MKYRGIKPAANRSHIYRSTEAQCRDCLRKAECTSGRYKQLVIHVDEEVRQRARERNQQPDYFRHQRSRKKIEALFGELKNRICLRRARLRRLRHVQEQFLMAATAQNLKRLVRFLATMPPAKDKLRNQNRVEISSAARNRSVSGPHFLRRRTLFQQLQTSGHFESRHTRSPQEGKPARLLSPHGKNKLEERRHMSSQNGDKARFNRLRKQKLHRRELMARLATQSAANAARLDKTPLAKLAQE